MPNTSTIPRRPLILDQGQSLLIATDAMQAALDFAKFSSVTGVPATHLVASRMSPIPFPVRSGRPDGGTGRRRIPGVRPDAMWLPLLWLPPRLEQRYTYQIIDNEVVVATNRVKPRAGYEVYVETDELWTIRAALELGAAGIWDEESGGWLDVMGLAGLDVDDPGDIARISAWLDGEPDDLLDLLDTGLELGTLLARPENPHWALKSALAMYDSLRACAWALGADSLLGMVDSLLLDLEADEPGVVPFSDEQGLFVVEMLSAVGQSWFNDAVIPGEPLTEDAWWTDIKARLARRGGDSRYVSEFLLPELVDHLVAVREHFWPKVEQIVAVPEGDSCP